MLSSTYFKFISSNWNCRLNLRANDIPKCTPICTDKLPEAPYSTDLELKYVIPKAYPNELRELSRYGSELKPMYSGDKLVYHCKKDKWVIYIIKCTFHITFLPLSIVGYSWWYWLYLRLFWVKNAFTKYILKYSLGKSARKWYVTSLFTLPVAKNC